MSRTDRRADGQDPRLYDERGRARDRALPSVRGRRLRTCGQLRDPGDHLRRAARRRRGHGAAGLERARLLAALQAERPCGVLHVQARDGAVFRRDVVDAAAALYEL